MTYSWPGNVRELENAIERAVVLGQSDVLLPEDLPETVLESASVPEVPGALQSSVTESKRQLIVEAWRQSERRPQSGRRPPEHPPQFAAPPDPQSASAGCAAIANARMKPCGARCLCHCC